MNCEWLAENIDAYELGLVPEEARREAEAHLASCPVCRELLAAVRSSDRAVRAALAWAEPSEGFSSRVVSRARRQVLVRQLLTASVAAAAAACFALALFLGLPRPPAVTKGIGPPVPPPAVEAPATDGKLLVGEVYDGYGLAASRLVQGRPYVAAGPAALGMDPGSLLMMTGGSQFAAAPVGRGGGAGVSLLAGSMVGHVGARHKELTVELAPELGGAIARTKGCEFYSSGFPAHRLAAGLPFPADALARWPEEIRVHVFSGHLDLDLGGQKMALGPGDSAIIAAGTTAGPSTAIEARIRQLRLALGEDTIAKRDLYEGLCDDYARRLLVLRAMTERDGLPYLPERIRLVEDLLHAHGVALARLEAKHPELLELDAALAEQHRLEQLREMAHRALDRFLAMIGPGG